MKFSAIVRSGAGLVLALGLSACGSIAGLKAGDTEEAESSLKSNAQRIEAGQRRDSTIWDLFGSQDDPNVTVEVNRYIWNAAFDVLNFLPVEAADPFSGIIVMGYGTPPGSRRSYRATVFVRDPALDARSLSVSLQTRSGPVSRDTVRAIEDAILTRARQLRIRDGEL